MNIAIGLTVSSLFSRMKDKIIYHSKHPFWGKIVVEKLADSPTPEFKAAKLLTVWDKTIKWGVLLEIDQTIADPQPTAFQKMRYLHITENLDAYFLPAMRTLHLLFGEVKEYVIKYRRHIYPRLITLPLSAETEWSIYFQTSELT